MSLKCLLDEEPLYAASSIMSVDIKVRVADELCSLYPSGRGRICHCAEYVPLPKRYQSQRRVQSSAVDGINGELVLIPACSIQCCGPKMSESVLE